MSPAQVRFSRPESEQARQRRVQSYEFLQKKQAEEPWVHLHYCGLRVSGGGAGGFSAPLHSPLRSTAPSTWPLAVLQGLSHSCIECLPYNAADEMSEKLPLVCLE